MRGRFRLFMNNADRFYHKLGRGRPWPEAREEGGPRLVSLVLVPKLLRAFMRLTGVSRRARTRVREWIWGGFWFEKSEGEGAVPSHQLGSEGKGTSPRQGLFEQRLHKVLSLSPVPRVRSESSVRHWPGSGEAHVHQGRADCAHHVGVGQVVADHHHPVTVPPLHVSSVVSCWHSERNWARSLV